MRGGSSRFKTKSNHSLSNPREPRYGVDGLSTLRLVTWCFPSYTNAEGCNGNSASAALNKWLKANFCSDAVVQGFRRAFRDRLRAVNCPTEMIDQLGGWSTTNVGGRYGLGFGLKQKEGYMVLI